jgi:hypothetical protein
MKNYFKTYYKTRINNGILNEQVNVNDKFTQNALFKHSNIMEGYNPEGRDSGIMNPNNRANYIKHFTNFLKEKFENDNINWKESRSIHEYFVAENNSSYIAAFTDFMNAPSTNIIIENVELNENEHGEHPFITDVLAAVKKHVKNPNQTISSAHGDNFDIMDHARSAADHIEYHMRKPEAASPVDRNRHDKRVRWLKSVLPDDIVDELISKHFKKK